MQRTLEGAWLLNEIGQRGYAEFHHEIPDEQIEYLIDRYADFTLNHPDPLPETMDAMLPSKPSVIDLKNPAFYDNHKKFLTGNWVAKKLDELDDSKDTQTEWHKYRTNVYAVGKPDGYTNRSFQELRSKKLVVLLYPRRIQKNSFISPCNIMPRW